MARVLSNAVRICIDYLKSKGIDARPCFRGMWNITSSKGRYHAKRVVGDTVVLYDNEASGLDGDPSVTFLIVDGDRVVEVDGIRMRVAVKSGSIDIGRMLKVVVIKRAPKMPMTELSRRYWSEICENEEPRRAVEKMTWFYWLVIQAKKGAIDYTTLSRALAELTGRAII